MDGNICGRAGSEIIIRELGDDGIRILNSVLVEKTYITELAHLAEIGGSHHRIAQPSGADIAKRLEVHEKWHLFPAYFDPPVRQAIRDPADLIVARSVNRSAGRCGCVPNGADRSR